MKQCVILAIAAMSLLGCNQSNNMNILNLTQEWDKTLPKSELVNHSRYFSEGAFEAMAGVKPEAGKSTILGNKELLIIPGAVHVDLYDDKAGVIPYDKIESFFKENLK